MQKNNKSILFICPYPIGYAPSQRFRFEQYLNLLAENGYEFRIEPFLMPKTWNILYRKSNIWDKILGVCYGYFRRIKLLPSVKDYQFLFIHREATPFGPPWFEWIVFRILKKKIIFDFDDAIWISDRDNENTFTKLLKFRSKIISNIKWSWKVSCGNDYLRSFSSQFNKACILNPTTIDCINLQIETAHVINRKHKEIVIGWTGSHSTLGYLSQIDPILHLLFKKYDFLKFLIIANKKPVFQKTPFDYIEWNKQTEIEDLLKIDIGIMPLPNNEWTKGKCGFKLLQFMALGIPSVGSRVGANINIIVEGVNGLLSETEDEWFTALEQLIIDPQLRSRIGKNGRKTVTERFSVQSNASNFLDLFKV